MSLQFVWQGFDSLLAAPLVLDPVRFAELSKRRAEAGGMPHLAAFFKAPLGVDEHRLSEQFHMLHDYVQRAADVRRNIQVINNSRPHFEPSGGELYQFLTFPT